MRYTIKQDDRRQLIINRIKAILSSPREQSLTALQIADRLSLPLNRTQTILDNLVAAGEIETEE